MTPAPELESSRRWVDQGTETFLAALTRTADDAMAGPSALPGWSGRHLVAHVAANAEALLNLARWASTGEETPMYSSPRQREADIETGAHRTPGDLRRWAGESADRLAAALAALDDDSWRRMVCTAQGRTVPATEVPWLRARELMVHAVDLDPALRFADLPEDFLLALVDDVVARRSSGEQPALLLIADGDRHTWTMPGLGEPIAVGGSVGGIAAYLVGRPGSDVASPSGTVPNLPAWL